MFGVYNFCIQVAQRQTASKPLRHLCGEEDAFDGAMTMVLLPQAGHILARGQCGLSKKAVGHLAR